MAQSFAGMGYEAGHGNYCWNARGTRYRLIVIPFKPHFSDADIAKSALPVKLD